MNDGRLGCGPEPAAGPNISQRPFPAPPAPLPAIQMVIPGDPEEMRTFQSRALALSRCSLEVVLPSAHVFLPSKEVYESLYNRWRCGQAGGGVARGWARPPSCHHLPIRLS